MIATLPLTVYGVLLAGGVIGPPSFVTIIVVIVTLTIAGLALNGRRTRTLLLRLYERLKREQWD
jgi:hypothetical protein